MNFKSFLTLGLVSLSSAVWTWGMVNPANAQSLESYWAANPTVLEKFQPDQPVTSLDVSPRGDFVVSGTESAALHIWDLRAQRVMRTLQSHTEKVTSVMFSPNGQTFVSASTDKTIKIWNLAMLRLRMTIYTNSEIYSVAVSPHGQTFASGNAEGKVEIWNLNTGKKRREFSTPMQSVVRVAYSPDGERLATSYPHTATVHFWNPLTGEFLGTGSPE